MFRYYYLGVCVEKQQNVWFAIIFLATDPLRLCYSLVITIVICFLFLTLSRLKEYMFFVYKVSQKKVNGVNSSPKKTFSLFSHIFLLLTKATKTNQMGRGRKKIN